MIFTSHLFVVPLFLSGDCEESRGRGFVRFSSLRQTRLVGAQHEPCVYTRTNAYRVRIRTLFRWWMSHRLPNIPSSLDRRRVMFPPHLWPTSRGKISRRTENWHRFFCLVFSILFFIFLYISSHILFRAIRLFSRAPGDGDRPAPHWSFAVDGVRLALLLSLSLFLTVQRRLPFVFFSKDIGHVVTWRKHPALFTRRLVCFHQRPSKMFACFYFSSWRQSLDTVSARPMAHQCLATCVSTPALPSTIVLVVYFRDIL